MPESTMGYLALLKSATQPAKKKEKPRRKIDPLDVLLAFDSGRGMSFADARHHLMAFGTTGSGKTAALLLPMIFRIIRAGHGIILGDIKGSLGKAVRKLAASCGREEDVVEYGSGPLAERKNFIAFMSDDGLRSYFEHMVKEVCPSGDSRIWALKGAVAAADCAILMRHIAKKRPGFWPTLSMVNEMINDQARASALYNLYLENWYDENDEVQKDFVTAIDGNRFHILTRAKAGFLGSKPASPDRTQEEQLTWNMQAIRLALRQFLDAPGMKENFSAYACMGIDLPGDIDAGKIILIRFDSRSGQAGASLTRKLLSEAYRHVLSGEMPRDRKLFVVLDEFQEYCDLSDSSGSDKTFVALAREFGGSFIAGTQSVAALTCKVGSNMPVEAFLGNCNSIMSFYSHDAATQELALRYNHRIKLNRLKPGQLFAVTYDSASRTHDHSLEKVNKGYREMAELLASLPDPGEGPEEKRIPDPSWASMVGVLQKEIEAKKEAEKLSREEEKRREREEYDRKCREERERLEQEKRQEASEESVPGMEDYDDDDGTERMMLEELESRRNRRNEEELDPFVAKLMEEFPDLFTDDFRKADIPTGWKAFTVEALRLFKATGMSTQIRFLTVEEGAIKAVIEGRRDKAAWEVLNQILSQSGKLCMVCGRERGEGLLPVCADCRKRHAGNEQGHSITAA